MRTNLKEKVALVTGASSGLGARFARVLAANGALTVLAARRLERLKDLRAEIEAAGGAAHIVALDVTDQESIEAAIEQTEREVGPIDILINNSGVSTAQRLTEVTPVDYDFMFDTNVKGAFFVAQAVARQMIARSKQQQGLRGRIVNIASIAGLRVLPDIGVYCMTQGSGDSHDALAGGRMGSLWHQRQRDLSRIHPYGNERCGVGYRARREVARSPAAQESRFAGRSGWRAAATGRGGITVHQWRDHRRRRWNVGHVKEFVIEVPLRWGDMDAMSHLNNLMYFRLMEEARIQWFAYFGFPTLPVGEAPILAHAGCDFLKAMTYPGTAIVTQIVTRLGVRVLRCR